MSLLFTRTIERKCNMWVWNPIWWNLVFKWVDEKSIQLQLQLLWLTDIECTFTEISLVWWWWMNRWSRVLLFNVTLHVTSSSSKLWNENTSHWKYRKYRNFQPLLTTNHRTYVSHLCFQQNWIADLALFCQNICFKEMAYVMLPRN
jgi:hypothetical protein